MGCPAAQSVSWHLLGDRPAKPICLAARGGDSYTPPPQFGFGAPPEKSRRLISAGSSELISPPALIRFAFTSALLLMGAAGAFVRTGVSSAPKYRQRQSNSEVLDFRFEISDLGSWIWHLQSKDHLQEYIFQFLNHKSAFWLALASILFATSARAAVDVPIAEQ